MTTTLEKARRVRKAEYGSDVIVDMLRAVGIEYVALNPGATFRGLHDSLVNYGGNQMPETITCTHEETAVALAHGYARAAGKPMAAAVHNIVGLLHASMAIFNAWQDRAPVMVLGGTGPMDVERRRPWIDWVHTALVQGNAVRDFTKWDDQPSSVISAIESILRAHQLMVTEPQGPVYLCFDAALQEQRLDSPFTMPEVPRFAGPSRLQADPAALERAAELLLAAERPVVIADYLGKAPQAVEALIRLAEGLSLPVIDLGDLLSFPSRHPLNLTGAERELLREADVILALDVKDLQQPLTTLDRVTRLATPIPPAAAKIVDISLRHYTWRAWTHDFGRLQAVDLPVAADTALAVPTLADLCLRKLAEQPGRKSALQRRGARLKARHEALAQEAAEAVKQASGQEPIGLPFLVQQVWEKVRDYDWVLADNELRGSWPRRLWDITKPYQFIVPGGGGGLGGGYGRSLGIALANRGTGRLCVNFQGDGDLLFTPSSLWTAAHHGIPLLTVMQNNHSYYNDEDHQGSVARVRGRAVENKGIGTRIENPAVDFAAMARSFGVHGEGPIEDPEELGPALERATQVVMEQGRSALVDVITQVR
jgi:thiamine pyrophosphate-dependent acetolactate synthase large subunit-like protein